MFRSIYVKVAAIGLALLLTGALLGADTTYYWDLKGLHSAKAMAGQHSAVTGQLASLQDMGTDDQQRKVLQGNVEAFTQLDIDAGSAVVEIIPSDRFSLEIASRNFSKIEYTNEGGVCRIKSNDQFEWRIFSFTFADWSDHIKITIPRNTVLTGANLDVASGSMRVEELSADAITANVASGEIEMKGIAADRLKLGTAHGFIRLTDVSAQALDANVISGTLEGASVRSQGASVDVTNGDANLEGEFLGESRLHVTSGSVGLRISGNRSEYSLTTSVISGDCLVDGQPFLGSYANAQAPHTIDMSAVSGTLRIDFER